MQKCTQLQVHADSFKADATRMDEQPAGAAAQAEADRCTHAHLNRGTQVLYLENMMGEDDWCNLDHFRQASLIAIGVISLPQSTARRVLYQTAGTAHTQQSWAVPGFHQLLALPGSFWLLPGQAATWFGEHEPGHRLPEAITVQPCLILSRRRCQSIEMKSKGSLSWQTSWSLPTCSSSHAHPGMSAHSKLL